MSEYIRNAGQTCARCGKAQTEKILSIRERKIGDVDFIRITSLLEIPLCYNCMCLVVGKIKKEAIRYENY